MKIRLLKVLLTIVIIFSSVQTIVHASLERNITIESLEYDPNFNTGDTVNLKVSVKNNEESGAEWVYVYVKDPDNSFHEIKSSMQHIYAGETGEFTLSFTLNSETDYLGTVFAHAEISYEVKETFRYILEGGGGIGSRIQVVDLNTSEPIEGALVTIERSSAFGLSELTEEGYTNSEGYYYVEELSYPGSYLFEASKEGYACDNNCCKAGGYMNYSRFFDASLELKKEDGGTNETQENASGTSDTPGFEIALVVCAIALVFFWKRKR